MRDGPLDMRMDQREEKSAADIVNHASESELGDIFREFGEERYWRKIAATIVRERKNGAIRTTKELADLVIGAVGFRGKRGIHPATLVFQALRIAVNHELSSIEEGLSKAIGALNKGGIIGVLSFHSLEDRIVKNLFKGASLVRKGVTKPPLLRLFTKKPLTPTKEETRRNPRARSAKLRVAEKL